MGRISDRLYLHPYALPRVVDLQSRLGSLGIPLDLYESIRTPFRQADLYLKGRMGNPGGIVTKAQAWGSLHQYGLAADFVFFVDGKWTWKEPEPGMWDAFHEEAKRLGLSPIGFEKPHVQFTRPLNDLRAGKLFDGEPPFACEAFLSWFSKQVETWGASQRNIGGLMHPGAPPLIYDERPAMEDYA